MPVRKCSNGKWRIGEGPCIYKSEKSAERAYRGYLAAKREEPMTTTSANIAARFYKRRKRRKVRKPRAPGMATKFTLAASAEQLDEFIEQAIADAFERVLEGR